MILSTNGNSFKFRPGSPTDMPATPVTNLIIAWVKEQLLRSTRLNSPQALERCPEPFSPIWLPSISDQLYPTILFRGSSNRLCWETCSHSHPLCCSLFLNKGTYADELEASNAGLTEVVAACRSDFVAAYFIRQVPRRSSLRQFHLCWPMLAISLSSILLPPTSNMHYSDVGWTLSLFCSFPPNGDLPKGGVRECGRG